MYAFHVKSRRFKRHERNEKLLEPRFSLLNLSKICIQICNLVKLFVTKLFDVSQEIYLKIREVFHWQVNNKLSHHQNLLGTLLFKSIKKISKSILWPLYSKNFLVVIFLASNYISLMKTSCAYCKCKFFIWSKFDNAGSWSIGDR